MRAGDLIIFKQETLDRATYIQECAPAIRADTPYELRGDKGSWHVKNPEGANLIYIDLNQVERYIPNRQVTVYKYIVIDKPVSGLEVGAHYEVQSVNINGSYLVPSNTYSNAVVAPEKCHPWVQGGTKRVPCRHPSFSLGLDGPVYPEGYQVEPSKLTGAKQPQPFQIQQAPKGVKKQKAVAQELLRYAFMMSPQAFMAGGAPRNWRLGLMANDLDIFIRKPYQASESDCKRAMEFMGITDIFNKANEEAPGVLKKARYSQENVNEDKRASDQRIEFVLEGKYMGETVQFIFLEHSSTTGLAYCHRYFDTSINMISVTLDREGELVTTPSPRFDDSMKTGVIFVQENGSAYGNGDHLERIHSYFPEAPMVREKYREEVVRNLEKAFKLAEDWEDLI